MLKDEFVLCAIDRFSLFELQFETLLSGYLIFKKREIFEKLKTHPQIKC